MPGNPSPPVGHDVTIRTTAVPLRGQLDVPESSTAVILFAHGSGSGRFSPRNRFVARRLQTANLATLLIDLLSEEEERLEQDSGHLRFDIPLLADRLAAAIDWLGDDPRTARLPVGCFGASTGAAAALVAASERPTRVGAVVSRGGRPDLAGDALPRVQAPTLLIVGGNDRAVLQLNEAALERLGTREKELRVIPGATHLFEEPGALDEVAGLAADWFRRHLPRRATS